MRYPKDGPLARTLSQADNTFASVPPAVACVGVPVVCCRIHFALPLPAGSEPKHVSMASRWLGG